MDRRRGNGRGTDLAVRGEHLLDRAESAAAELAGDRIGALQNRINHSDEANRFALFFKFFVNAGMIASEDAYTNDCDRNRIVSLQRPLLAGGCQLEQAIVNAQGSDTVE